MSKWSLCSARDGGSMAGSRAPNRARRRRAIDHFVFFILNFSVYCKFAKQVPEICASFLFDPITSICELNP
ncbi:BnaC02g30080D [Brassica napus]|uniref:BnaC02g30080D protein n=1 Tax=Brassica napus TaxID=3708 RepID=A0A078GJ61_BRANA|nr:BnaC02g30080D [Brassica napus]